MNKLSEQDGRSLSFGAAAATSLVVAMPLIVSMKPFGSAQWVIGMVLLALATLLLLIALVALLRRRRRRQ